MKRNYSFQRKLVYSYLIFMLMMVLFSISFWLIQFSREQEDTQRAQLAMLAQQSSVTIDQMLDRVNYTLYLHLENDVIQRILMNDAPQASDELNLYYLARGVVMQNQDLLSIAFVGYDGRVYANEVEPFNSTEIYSILSGCVHNVPKERLLSDIVNRCLNYAGGRSGIAYIDSPRVQIIDGQSTKVLPIYKEMINLDTGMGIGYVLICLDFSRLCQNLNISMGDNNISTLLLSPNGEELYISNCNYELSNLLKEYLADDNFMSEFKDDMNGFYYSTNELCAYGVFNEHTGWQVIRFHKALHGVETYYPQIIWFIIITIGWYIVVAIIASHVSRQLSKNIRLLYKTFTSAKTSSPQKIPEDKIHKDEIAKLIISYNCMIDRLNQSIENEYASSLRAKEMQIKMLSYQINPHFLYNCLNLISSLAIIRNASDISHVAHILGEMFHFSIDGGDIVSIRDEMNHTMNYLEIQKIRFPNQFDINYDIDIKVLDFSCLKFILQPVVENCVSHGFLSKKKQRNQIIHISIHRIGDDVIFGVMDNGSGINAVALAQIRENLYSPMDNILSPHDSLGLWNIHKRIESYYGKPYGILLESEEGEYTCVTLRIPLRMEEVKTS